MEAADEPSLLDVQPSDTRKDPDLRRTFLLVAILMAALFSFACGSDDDQQQAATARQAAAPAEQEQQQVVQQAEQPQQQEQPAEQAEQPAEQAQPAQQASQQQAVAQAAEQQQQQSQPAEQTQQDSQQQAAASQSSQTAQAAVVRTFIDDLGTEFSTDSDDLVVVAEASVAAALMEFGVTLSGVFGQTEDAEGNPYGGADFSGLQFVGGDAYGEISLEALSELQPDVVVTISWGTDNCCWWLSADLIDEVSQIATLLIVNVSDGKAGVPAPQVIARLDELSVVLGGSGGSEESKAAFAEAEAMVRSVAAENPDITLMFASASTDTFYIADPPAWPDLSYFVALGVNVLRTETTEGGYWEYLSLESIDKYDVDHILLDDRDPGQATRLQADVPLWATLPAVQAEQISLWPISGRVYTYNGFASVLNHIAEAITSSADVS